MSEIKYVLEFKGPEDLLAKYTKVKMLYDIRKQFAIANCLKYSISFTELEFGIGLDSKDLEQKNITVKDIFGELPDIFEELEKIGITKA